MDNWYCIYTKPAREDSVARKLADLLGLQVFNPKIRRRKYSRAKLVESVEGLFPCYFFARFDPAKHLHTIRYTRGIRRFVGNGNGTPYMVDDSIIKCIQSQAEDGLIVLKSAELAAGDKILVKDGPFSGLSGLFLVDLKPNERVLILLDAIRYQATLQIHRQLVARA